MADNAIPHSEAEERKRGLGQIVVWIVVGLVLLFLALGLMQAFSAQPDTGTAPDFTLQGYDGNTYNLSELRGQVVVINFWASWCAPCAEEAPDLEQAWQDYRDRGVMFLGVDYVDSDQKGREYLEKYNITYPNGPDLRTEISEAYNITGVPETFIVNKHGEVTFFVARPLSYQELAAEIEKALAQ